MVPDPRRSVLDLPTRSAYNGSTLVRFATLLLAGAGSFIGMRWGYLNANVEVGTMWKQILATLIAYGVFLGVMTVALIVRPSLLRR